MCLYDKSIIYIKKMVEEILNDFQIIYIFDLLIGFIKLIAKLMKCNVCKKLLSGVN